MKLCENCVYQVSYLARSLQQMVLASLGRSLGRRVWLLFGPSPCPEPLVRLKIRIIHGSLSIQTTSYWRFKLCKNSPKLVKTRFGEVWHSLAWSGEIWWGHAKACQTSSYLTRSCETMPKLAKTHKCILELYKNSLKLAKTSSGEVWHSLARSGEILWGHAIACQTSPNLTRSCQTLPKLTKVFQTVQKLTVACGKEIRWGLAWFDMI